MTSDEEPRRRRGMLLLPTTLTLGNIFCGFTSVIASVDREFATAAIFIIIAVFLDGLDGKVARWAHAESAFGLELDSLADVVSFGIAPATALYIWGLRDLGRLGWMSAFLFLICGAMRLARFNVLAGQSDTRYFVGLPIPAAAGAVAAVVYWRPQPVMEPSHAFVVLLMTTLLAFLMVSRVRYASFKKLDFTRRRAVTTLVWLIVILYLVAVEPQTALLVVAVIYTVSGPLGFAVGLFRGTRPTEVEAEDTASDGL